MAYPNSRGQALELAFDTMEDNIELQEKRIERLIAQVAKLEKRLNLFNQNRTIAWKHEAPI